MPQAQIAATSDEYVLDQLSTSEEKLLKLLEELDGKDLQQVVKEMEEEEVIVACYLRSHPKEFYLSGKFVLFLLCGATLEEKNLLSGRINSFL